MLKRTAYFAYGSICYLMFLAAFGYAVGFLTDALVPRSVNKGPASGLAAAVAINAMLLLLFGLQHSVMARPAFKRWWLGIIPEPIERATYVLASNLAFAVLFWQWRPINTVIWDLPSGLLRTAVWGLFAAGLLLVLWATFLLNHFELFGMRQVTLYLMGRPYTRLPFKMPMLYKHVRHPLYVGWMATFWAAPTMTVGHFLFSLISTLYILVAIRLEERNLIEAHGADYVAYRSSVPMLIPLRLPGSSR